MGLGGFANTRIFSKWKGIVKCEKGKQNKISPNGFVIDFIPRSFENGRQTRTCMARMESYLSEEALWAGGLASRLRLIQANFADDSSSIRQGYIIEEIERAIKPV